MVVEDRELLKGMVSQLGGDEERMTVYPASTVPADAAERTG
jgi:hypothetical protein